MHPLPLGPRLVWSVDVIVITINGVTRYIVVAVCCFTKYVFLRVLDTKTSSRLAVFLADLIACFGIMQVIRVDNGTEFGGEFATLCEQHGIQRDVQLPYHSRGNGQVERVNRSVQSLLRRMLCHVQVPEHLAMYTASVQLALNSTASRSTGFPAYLLMYGSLPLGATPQPASALLSAEPSAAELSAFRQQLQARVTLLSKAATAAHAKYRAK